MHIRSFAKKLNISESTVSRAFSGKGKVKPETRQRIFNLAAELDYRPNGYLANNNIPFSQDMVAVIYVLPIRDLYSDYLFAEVFKGIESVLISAEMQASAHIIFESSMLDSFYFDLFKANNIKGVIWFSSTNKYCQIKERIDYWGKPNVIIGNYNSDNISNVWFDVRGGCRQIGDYFRRTGRRNPAVVLGSFLPNFLANWNQQLDEKELGFVEGMQCTPSDVLWVNGGYSFLDGYNAFSKIMLAREKIDCVFCENDTLAAGLLAANDGRIKIPEDMAVFGFDNVAFSQFTIPSLSTVDFSKYEMGKAAAQGLLKIINGEEQKINLTFKSNLILRHSS